MSNPASVPVIIDTDIGTDIDDTWALVMALGCPELDIRMIVTCTGDTSYRAKLVCKLLERAGRTDIPVGIGPSSDTGPSQQKAWVDDYELSRYPGTVHGDGVEAVAREIADSDETVTLICIGPLPNIGDLLRRFPETGRRARFVGMHGAIYRGYFGSEEVHAEYNVKQHLGDAQEVFASNLPKTITPLDTCGIVRLLGERYARVLAGGSRSLTALFENYRHWLQEIDRDVSEADRESSVLFDTVAIYLGFDEQLLEIEELPIVVTDEGKTVVSEAGQPVRAAVGWRDYEGFLDLLTDRLLMAP